MKQNEEKKNCAIPDYDMTIYQLQYFNCICITLFFTKKKVNAFRLRL